MVAVVGKLLWHSSWQFQGSGPRFSGCSKGVCRPIQSLKRLDKEAIVEQEPAMASCLSLSSPNKGDLARIEWSSRCQVVYSEKRLAKRKVSRLPERNETKQIPISRPGWLWRDLAVDSQFRPIRRFPITGKELVTYQGTDILHRPIFPL